MRKIPPGMPRRDVRPEPCAQPRPARGPWRYGRRARASQLGFGKAVMGAIVAAAVVLAGVGYLVTHLGIRAAGAGTGGAGSVARQFIYTARTANDAPITLPDAVINNLLQIGLAHQSIALTRVDPTGNVSTSFIDMTPRTGNSSSDPVIEVPGLALPKIDAKISDVETAINSPAATGGGQALYAGLTRTDFTAAPVTIISSGLDLANPDNFRDLRWSVPAEEVVANVRKAGALPAVHDPVTFVIVPTAGPQPQLGHFQKNYLESVWRALLTAAGASSVKFIDANSTTASSGGPSAPIVPVPGLPGTPISSAE